MHLNAYLTFDGLDLFSRDIIDVHLSEWLEEVSLSHHAFRRLPRHLLDAAHDYDTLTHDLHRFGRLGKWADLSDIRLIQVFQRQPGGLQSRQSLGQRILSFFLLRNN